MGGLAAWGGLGIALLGLAVAGGCRAETETDQFCHDHATAFCRKLYACPDPGVQISGTQADCVAAFATLCEQPPATGTTDDVNCSGGKHVDPAARELCLAELDRVSCADFNASSYLDSCPEVCRAD